MLMAYCPLMSHKSHKCKFTIYSTDMHYLGFDKKSGDIFYFAKYMHSFVCGPILTSRYTISAERCVIFPPYHSAWHGERFEWLGRLMCDWY